jgi:hypothetical protein
MKIEAEKYAATLSARLTETSLCHEIQGEESEAFHTLFEKLSYYDDDEIVSTSNVRQENKQEEDVKQGDMEDKDDQGVSLTQNSAEDFESQEKMENHVEEVVEPDTLPNRNPTDEKQLGNDDISRQTNSIDEAADELQDDRADEGHPVDSALENGSKHFTDGESEPAQVDAIAGPTDSLLSKNLDDKEEEEEEEEEKGIEESAPGLSLLSNVVSADKELKPVGENQTSSHTTKVPSSEHAGVVETGKSGELESRGEQSTNVKATFKEMTPLAAVHPKLSSTSKESVVAGARSYLTDSAKAWGGTQTAVELPVESVQPDRTIPYEELKAMRADSGIDMTHKEKYLSDEEFVKIFKKERNAFLSQPFWRQQLQKKDVGLW